MISCLRNNNLKGKVVILASNRSGVCIPSELAKLFCAEEAVVHSVDTNDATLGYVQENVEKHPSQKVQTHRIDYDEPEQIEELVKRIRAQEGRIDVLVTDFGLLEFVPHLKPFHLQTKAEWRRQYRYIVEHAFAWTKAVIPFLIESSSGRIIHISSEAARVGTPGMAVYGAAKAAVAAFTRSVAAEVARYKITANCVSLGAQEIEKRDETSMPSITKLEKIIRAIPLRRYGEPEEVAYVVAFLASDLGAYITGQNISVSGGMVMV